MEYEILARDCRLPPTLQFIMLLEDIEEAGTLTSEIWIRYIFHGDPISDFSVPVVNLT